MKPNVTLLSVPFLLAILVSTTNLAHGGNQESRNIEFEPLESGNSGGGSESRNIEFELLLQQCAAERAAAHARGESYKAGDLCRELEASSR
jgi:hypothetical protein